MVGNEGEIGNDSVTEAQTRHNPEGRPYLVGMEDHPNRATHSPLLNRTPKNNKTRNRIPSNRTGYTVGLIPAAALVHTEIASCDGWLGVQGKPNPGRHPRIRKDNDFFQLLILRAMDGMPPPMPP